MRYVIREVEIVPNTGLKLTVEVISEDGIMLKQASVVIPNGVALPVVKAQIKNALENLRVTIEQAVTELNKEVR